MVVDAVAHAAVWQLNGFFSRFLLYVIFFPLHPHLQWSATFFHNFLSHTKMFATFFSRSPDYKSHFTVYVRSFICLFLSFLFCFIQNINPIMLLPTRSNAKPFRFAKWSWRAKATANVQIRQHCVSIANICHVGILKWATAIIVIFWLCSCKWGQWMTSPFVAAYFPTNAYLYRKWGNARNLIYFHCHDDAIASSYGSSFIFVFFFNGKDLRIFHKKFTVWSVKNEHRKWDCHLIYLVYGNWSANSQKRRLPFIHSHTQFSVNIYPTLL